MKLHDDIHNYYEHLILEKLEKLGTHKTKGPDYIADLCCLALNQVPPRYIRFDVDMSFYLQENERQQMEMNVSNAITKAMAYLDEKQKEVVDEE